jgi:hypothetical protein
MKKQFKTIYVNGPHSIKELNDLYTEGWQYHSSIEYAGQGVLFTLYKVEMPEALVNSPLPPLYANCQTCGDQKPENVHRECYKCTKLIL